MYIGDEYLESIDYLEKLPKDVLNKLYISGVLQPQSLEQAWLLSDMRLVTRYQNTIGYAVFDEFMKKHPEYLKKLKLEPKQDKKVSPYG